MMDSKAIRFGLLLTLAAVCAALPKASETRGGKASVSAETIQEQITPGNGLDRGDWGNVDLCPTGTFVSSFEFKSQDLGYLDDTAGNGIKLYCVNDQGIQAYVTSSIGQYGTWRGLRTCSDSSNVLIGFRLEVLGPQGAFHDDMGVTNVQMMCSVSHETLDGLSDLNKDKKQVDHEVKKEFITREMVTLEDGRTVEKIKAVVPLFKDSPSFGPWVQCSAYYSFCGLQTRVEPIHAVDDDAGLTDVIIFCC